jgi:hypothetical protein
VPKVAFAKVQRVQKVEETPNEFKRTRLVISMVGGRTESGGGNRWKGVTGRKSTIRQS